MISVIHYLCKDDDTKPGSSGGMFYLTLKFMIDSYFLSLIQRGGGGQGLVSENHAKKDFLAILVWIL